MSLKEDGDKRFKDYASLKIWSIKKLRMHTTFEEREYE